MVYTTPRGYNTLLEVDLLYPLPDKPRYPKPKNPTPKPVPMTPPPPPPPPPPQIIHPDNHDHDHDHDHSPTFSQPYFNQDHPGEVWMPPSGWKDDILANINDKPSMDASHSMNMSMTMRKNDWSNSYSNPYWNENMNWRNVIEDTKIYPTPPPGYLDTKQNLQKFDFMSNHPNHINSNHLPSSQSLQRSNLPSGYKSSYYLPRGRSLNVERRETKDTHEKDYFEFNADDHEDWEYLHHHKDRRDLYQLIETAFKLR